MALLQVGGREFGGTWGLRWFVWNRVYRSLNATHIMKDVLIQLIINITKLRGQCYDGASSMAYSSKGAASQLRHSIPFHRAKNTTTSEWFEILYTFTTNCCKNILKVSGHTPSRKPNYSISTSEFILTVVLIVKFCLLRSDEFLVQLQTANAKNLLLCIN